MPYVRSLQVHRNSDRRDELQSQLLALQNDIAHYQRVIAEQDELATAGEAFNEWHKKLELYPAGDFMPEVIASVARDNFNQAYYQTMHTIERAQHRATSYRNSLRVCEQRLPTAQMALRMCPPPSTYTFDLAALKATIRVPNITSIRLFETPHGQPILRVIFDGIIMKPSTNSYLWINQGNETRIKLPPLVADLNLRNNEVTLKPPRGKITQYPRGMSGTGQAHPHITRPTGYPCLGDFGGPLMEALDQLDLPLALIVLRMFLQQAEANDAAGAYWPRWLLPDGGRGYTYHRESCFNQNTGRYTYVKTDDQGNATIVFSDQREWPAFDVKPEPVVQPQLAEHDADPEDELVLEERAAIELAEETAEQEHEFNEDEYNDEWGEETA